MELLVNTHPKLSNQTLRFLSAGGLIFLVFFCLKIGSPYSDLLIILGMVGLVHEWTTMSAKNLGSVPRMLLLSACLLAAYGNLSWDFYFGILFFSQIMALVLGKITTRKELFDMDFHPVILTSGCLSVVYEALSWSSYLGIVLISLGSCWFSRETARHLLLHRAGVLYITLSLGILLSLLHQGLSSYCLWIFLLVWSCDSGAYFTGRLLKGPKLAPVISPNKTWSGFLGGILCAVVVGISTASFLYPFEQNHLWILCICFGVISHLGDLLESFMKRFFNVKDSGNLIPGHGGLLDRMDSLLLVLFAAGAWKGVQPLLLRGFF